MFCKVGWVETDICRNSEITVSKGNADNDCCSEKAKIEKEQGITLTAISDNSNPHHTHKIPQQYPRLTIT